MNNTESIQFDAIVESQWKLYISQDVEDIANTTGKNILEILNWVWGYHHSYWEKLDFIPKDCVIDNVLAQWEVELEN